MRTQTHSPTSTATATDMLVLHNGKTAQTLRAGQPNVFKAQAGEHYRVLKYKGSEEHRLDNVIAKRSGNDLQLDYADGTQVTLANYYVACKGAQSCEASLPGQNGSTHKIEDGAGTALGDGTSLVYAHGSPEALLAMTAGQSTLRTTLAGIPGADITYMPSGVSSEAGLAGAAPSDGMGPLGWLGAAGGIGLAAAAGGGGGGGSPVPPPTDTSAPTVASVAIVSATGIRNGVLNAGDTILVAVNMSEVTSVSGQPQLALSIGGATVKATYVSGSGSSTLVFSYTIGAGASDINGIAIAADSLSLNGGKIEDAAGNAAKLNHAAVTDQIGYAVDTSAPSATLAPAVLTTTGSSATVRSGETGVAYLVNTSAGPMTLEAIAALADDQWNQVDISAANTNTSLLTTGLADGTYTLYTADAAGNLGVSSNSITVDINAPRITSIVLGSEGARNGTLNAGDVVTVTVNTSENALVTGIPQLTLNIGGTTFQADYKSGSGGKALIFTYTIVAGQTDTNGISIGADALLLSGGSKIADAHGHDAILAHAPVVDSATALVDTAAPLVTGVAITSATGATGNFLNAGDSVTVTVTMSEATVVTGTPQLALNIGGATVMADYSTGSGSASLVFHYKIVAGQTDANGISVSANAISLNNGTLTDMAGNGAVLTHAAVVDNGAFRVDTAAPAISSVAITSASGAQNGALNAGDVVSITVTTSEVVLVAGIPQLELKIGDTTVKASYASGSGSSALVFTYTIEAGQGDINGISLPANGITLNNGTLTDAAGNALPLDYSVVADNDSYLVDTTVPTVGSISFLPPTGAPDGILNVGDVVKVAVSMSAPAFINGEPQLALNIGGVIVKATYSSGNGSSNLVFSYTIKAGDTDSNGITIAANSITLNNGTLGNAYGTPANLDHAPIAAAPGHLVDTLAPSAIVAAATIASTGSVAVESTESGTAYMVDSNVVVTNLASITGAADRLWNSVALPSANAPVQLMAAGLVVGTYKVYTADAAGNLSPASANPIIINEAAPVVSSIALTPGVQGKPFNAGDVVTVTVNMTEATIVEGTPQVMLNIGGSIRHASYSSGSNSTALVFKYTVEAGLNDDNGISIAANSIVLNNGRLKDAANFDAVLTHMPVADTATVIIDTAAPIAQAAATTITSTGGSAVVQSSELGKVYLVSNTITPANEAAILALSPSQFKSGDITSVNFDTLTSTTDMLDGTYRVYTVDSAGNLSSAANNTITIDRNGPDAGLVALSATSSGVQGNTLNVGDVVRVTVAMNENTFVDTSGGVPTLKLTFDSGTVHAAYESGSGTSSLVFTYTILAGQNDTDGLSIDASSLALSGGTLKDGVGHNATLSNLALSSNNTYRVDTIAPTAQVTTATNAGDANVKSSETGTAYLVLDSVNAITVSDITSLNQNHWNSVGIGAANTWTPLSAVDLINGSYRVYTTDAAGNLSAESDGVVMIEGGVVTLAMPTPVGLNTDAGRLGFGLADVFEGRGGLFDALDATQMERRHSAAIDPVRAHDPVYDLYGPTGCELFQGYVPAVV